jgi:hypothetical protein
MACREKRCNKYLKDNRATWEEKFEVAALTWDEAIWPSVTAFRSKNPGQAVPCHLRDEYQITTKALLVMLFRKAARAHRKADKDNAMQILDTLLTRCSWPPDSMKDFNPGLVDVDAVCPLAPDAVECGLCEHMQKGFADALAEDSDLLALLIRCLDLCFSSSARCPVASEWYKHVLSMVASFIDEQAPECCEEDALRASHVVIEGNARKRRLDQDLRHAIVQSAMQSKRAKTPMAFVRATGMVAPTTAATWIPKHMGNIRAALFLSFKGCQHLALAFDAGRIGSPKEETLTVAALIVEQNKAQWLAPQAFGMI